MTSCLQTVCTRFDRYTRKHYLLTVFHVLLCRQLRTSSTHGVMPSPSPGKYRGSVVRQLSLQNQTPVPSPGPQRGLKKQLSEDYSRVLDAVEVTGQGWAGGSERSEPVVRIGSGDSKMGRATGTRPKPVKVAWADRKHDSLESPKGVEVVATKCQGQPRPMSVKAQRLRNPLLGNKDTLVYSRLQLAERLRNAWSEREKIKPNLNIFLAHTSNTAGNGNSEPSSDRTPGNTVPDTASTLSDPSAPLDKKRKSMQLRAFSQTICQSEDINPYELKFQNGYFTPQTEPTAQKEDTKEPNTPDKSPEDTGRYLQELNKIEIRVAKTQQLEGSENINPEEGGQATGDAPMSVKRSRNKVEIDENAGVGVKVETAQDRRANFRRSSVLHKTITESFSSRLPEEEKEKVPEVQEEVKNPLKPSLKKPPLVRAFSAPSHNEVYTDSKSNALQKKVKIVPPRKLQPTVSFDIPDADDPATVRERIKSAPIRRKLKTAAARRKNKDKDSSDEEKEPKDATNKKTTKRSQAKNGGDIVTMVSLVSPAVSDTEDSVINLPLESWRGDEKEDSVQKVEAPEQPKEDASFVVQKFVSLRKTAKSVSFQPHPVLNRSYSASFPSRRAPAGTPVIIPTPVVNNPALTPAQILERDKRPSIFSAINSGADGRGIKRRLLRSSTELPKKDEPFEENTNTESENDPDEASDSLTKDEDNDSEEKMNGEPDFKSPKERECWNLYQKMVQKGVAVSFDTVLRGMLTPTEYRLRKNSLLSTY